MPKLLEIKGLRTYFYTDAGVAKAVDDVSFSVDEGKTLGIVGESGCGKSVTSLSILQLIPSHSGKIEGGEILFQGENLLNKTKKEMQKIRGNNISMIFQEPMTSLNPVFTIGYQLIETIELHQELDKRKARERALEMLRLVKIPDPEQRINEYPHQLSGGMRQRVMIAMAIATNPQLLIADEPTTALDVTIQAQILELMSDIKEKTNTAIMLITHDLGVVAGMADDVAVMYAGKVVEYAPVRSIFKNPLHPYTCGLLESVPKLNEKKDKLHVIKGMVPSLSDMPQGCSFAPRCDKAMEICSSRVPESTPVDDHTVCCWLYHENKPETDNKCNS